MIFGTSAPVACWQRDGRRHDEGRGDWTKPVNVQSSLATPNSSTPANGRVRTQSQHNGCTVCLSTRNERKGRTTSVGQGKESEMRSWQMITGLVIGVAIPTGFYAAQASGPTLTVQDYMEIQQLYHRYHWVVDARNGDAWANLFTPDGEFHAGSTTTVGARESGGASRSNPWARRRPPRRSTSSPTCGSSPRRRAPTAAPIY